MPAAKSSLLSSTATKPQPQAPGLGPNQRHPDEAVALPLLMRVDEVMRERAISRRTVYELIKGGKLHLVRVGVRGSRIRTEEVLISPGRTSSPLESRGCGIRARTRSNPQRQAPENSHNAKSPPVPSVDFGHLFCLVTARQVPAKGPHT